MPIVLWSRCNWAFLSFSHVRPGWFALIPLVIGFCMSTWVLMDIRLLLGAPTRLSMLTQVQQLLHKHGTYDTTGGEMHHLVRKSVTRQRKRCPGLWNGNSMCLDWYKQALPNYEWSPREKKYGLSFDLRRDCQLLWDQQQPSLWLTHQRQLCASIQESSRLWQDCRAGG